jgi:arsenate reductase
MTVTIWHNPRCSKSRQTLELLHKKGVEPAIREYLKEPPSKAEVEKLIDMVGGDAGELIRDGETEFKSLKKKKKAELSKADIAKAIAAHPILLQRPIVVSGKRAAIGRPPEAVLPLLR